MKHLTRLFTLLIFASAAVLLSNCGGDDKDEPSVEETQLNKLKATWTLEEASLGGGDRTADFTPLQLTINGNFTPGGVYTYSFNGTRPNLSPWPANGTFSFVEGNEASQIERLEDNVIITYSVTANTLTLTFECDDCNAGGRVGSIEGEWEFVFTK